MKKSTLFTVLLLTSIVFAQSAGLIYFVHRSQSLAGKYEGIKAEYGKLSSQEKDLKSKQQNKDKEIATVQGMIKSAQNEKKEIQEKLNSLKEDRDNLLTRVKELLAKGETSDNLESSVVRLETEKKLLEEERDGLRKLTMLLKEEIEEFDITKNDLMAERDKYRSSASTKATFQIIACLPFCQ